MSAVDHKAETMLCVKYANSPQPGSPEVAANFMTQALVHATLYAAEQTAELVKQQRIENFIAFAQVEPDGPFYELKGDTRRRALDTIREGLGL